MIPWDFGIKNAIEKELGISLFPFSAPSEEKRTSPYLVIEFKNLIQGKNLTARAEFTITIANEKEITAKSFEISKNIGKIAQKELTLFQGDAIIGSAKFKIISIESKKNNLILNVVALLWLKAIYENDETAE